MASLLIFGKLPGATSILYETNCLSINLFQATYYMNMREKIDNIHVHTLRKSTSIHKKPNRWQIKCSTLSSHNLYSLYNEFSSFCIQLVIKLNDFCCICNAHMCAPLVIQNILHRLNLIKIHRTVQHCHYCIAIRQQHIKHATQTYMYCSSLHT
jgi:hypothetical protein